MKEGGAGGKSSGGCDKEVFLMDFRSLICSIETLSRNESMTRIPADRARRAGSSVKLKTTRTQAICVKRHQEMQIA